MATASAGRIREELERARSAGQVHGAYLFHGPPGTGKRATAYWWARQLLERGDGEGEFWHPDLHVVDPEGAVLHVGQVRELQKALSLTPNEGGWRVGLLFAAERMLAPAANALLKTLEEPPSRTSLVLVTPAPQALPPTILSRATGYRFRAQAEVELAEELRSAGVAGEDLWLVTALGGASVEAALYWAQDRLEDAREYARALDQLPQANGSDVLEFAESFRGGAPARARAEFFLDVHAAWVRCRLEQAARDGDRRALEGWLAQADEGTRARREMALRNLNPQLVVEGLLLALQTA